MDAGHHRFEQVLSEYGDALWRLTAAYARGHADREDLHQEILTALWTALPRFRGESSLRTFVYRVAHNRGITASTRARRRRTSPLEAAEPVVESGAGPEQLAEEKRRRESLHRAIRELPLSRRQVVVLRLEGLSHREIGEVVGITENNVAVRLSRARNDLYRELEEEI